MGIRSVTTLILFGLSVTTASADELHPCAVEDRSLVYIHEHPDARVRAAFVSVLRKADMQISRFALCETDDSLPVMGGLTQDERGEILAVALPAYTSAFSDEELNGLIGHEVGHVPKYGTSESGMRFESETDKQGAQWVGTAAMIAMLRALIREIDQFPLAARVAATEEFTYRINILSNP